MLKAIENKKTIAFEGICKNTKDIFLPFRYENSFADTTFSMLYSWNDEFDYHIHKFDNAIVVTDTDKQNQITYMIIMNDKITDLSDIISDICDRNRKVNQPVLIEYISERDIESYTCTLNKLNFSYRFETNEIYDDYIYTNEEFLNLSGNVNRSKRGGYNHFIKKFEGVKCCRYTNDMYSDIFYILDKWCEAHDCSRCFYGCEKNAVKRFMDIYDENLHYIYLAYDKDMPLSFAVCEQINSDTVSYYFQKNSVRERGLTYYLNREMALIHSDIKYINLGEDMGLIGLKNDKKNLHPCCMMKKYTLIIDL